MANIIVVPGKRERSLKMTGMEAFPLVFDSRRNNN